MTYKTGFLCHHRGLPLGLPAGPFDSPVGKSKGREGIFIDYVCSPVLGISSRLYHCSHGCPAQLDNYHSVQRTEWKLRECVGALDTGWAGTELQPHLSLKLVCFPLHQKDSINGPVSRCLSGWSSKHRSTCSIACLGPRAAGTQSH